MEVSRRYPQSVFNTQCQSLCEFLSKKEFAKKYIYEHQIEAVTNARKQLQNPLEPNIALVVLPTGCGKTGVAVLAAYALNATRVLVITPSLTISKQIHEAFRGSKTRRCFLQERGIIPANHHGEVIPSGTYIKATDEIRARMSDALMVVNAHKIGKQSNVKIEEIPNDSYDLVIVDEAHHYPADTWRLLVDHFQNSRRLFITATPLYKGKPILEHLPCFDLPRTKAVEDGVIRKIEFDEVPNEHGEEDFLRKVQKVAELIRTYLDQHDATDRTVRHQAMVMAQTIKDLNSTEAFKQAYDRITVPQDVCEVYVGNTSKQILDSFDSGKIRTLVVVGKLREGYDNKHVSVVGIVRCVGRQSKVLFTQFVGRAVRKARTDDPVTAMIVSHEMFDQRRNFEQFDTITEEENSDEE